MSLLYDAERYTRVTLRRHARAWPRPWHNDPDMPSVHHDLCSWIAHLLPTPKQSFHEYYLGFKEIRVTHLPMVLSLFPNSRIVVNYRHDARQQAMSSFWKESINSEEIIRNNTRYLLRTLHKSRHEYFPLALEAFSKKEFDRLLGWLRITGCKYKRVLHVRDHSSTFKPSIELLSGNCTRNMTRTSAS
eukprot:6213299-Pleurochrysis_carterae.AAC.3